MIEIKSGVSALLLNLTANWYFCLIEICSRILSGQCSKNRFCEKPANFKNFSTPAILTACLYDSGRVI